MPKQNYVSPSRIRSAFSASLSGLYRSEVPAYGTLLELVEKVNEETLNADPALVARLEATESLERISDERHGAIRLGTAGELAMIGRIFAVMGMKPVGYYDLSPAGVPVHSTAFRPVGEEALKRNPFRVFTSLLRLDLIVDRQLRAEAEAILAQRAIFTPKAIELTEKAELEGGLNAVDSGAFVEEILQTFRWHEKAIVSADMYRKLLDAHRLIADVVSFKGPHINHLTPRTLDIDAVQQLMPQYGVLPKAVIEGPPSRKCPILLRQTSFKALEEAVLFQDAHGDWWPGSHTARFGEIEQRGIALKPKGRALYDRLLNEAHARVRPAPDGSNAARYDQAMATVFGEFPDDWDRIRRQGLGYFAYSLTEDGKDVSGVQTRDLEVLIAQGLVQFDPIVYEDFLPVSAAGIFQSNLGDDARQAFVANSNQVLFEACLGHPVLDEFEHYARLECASIDACIRSLSALS